LARRDRIGAAVEDLRHLDVAVPVTRVHGDYHLGQVLVAQGDFVIVDFEGEPARSLAERRAKHSPLKDVAGMLRSFCYAAESGRMGAAGGDASNQVAAGWAGVWEAATGAAFLTTYLDTIAGQGVLPADRAAVATLLEAYLLDKVLYELQYELDNRPTWVGIPLRGVLALGG
jgi:maltose alpha-D-glucosyltransferase/alpha-amylase